MHLTKSIETNTGDIGEHFEIMAFSWDAHKREFSGHFALYKNAAARLAGKLPQKPIIAKVRCYADKFDQHFGHAALAKAGRNHIEQAYWVAQNDPECIVSDHQPRDMDGKIGTPLFPDAKLSP